MSKRFDIDAEIKSLETRLTKLKTLFRLRKEVSTLAEQYGGWADSEEALKAVARVVCEYYNLQFEAVSRKSRTESIAIPRMIIFYLARRLTNLTFEKIGGLFGKDHGTVIHGNRRIRERVETEPKFKKIVEELEANCIAILAQKPLDIP